MTSRPIVFLLPWFLAIVGCSSMSGPRTKMTAAVPATATEAALIREVAVIPFEGARGNEFTPEVVAALAGVRVNDAQYFRMAERTRLDALLQEIRRSQSGLVNRDDALKLGKLLGVKGIYTGIVDNPTYQSNRRQEKRTDCAEWEGGNKILSLPKCKRWVDKYVSCTTAEAVFAFTPKLVEVETGRIVYSSNVKGIASVSACDNEGLAMPSREQLIDDAKGFALSNFKKDVAPSSKTFDVALMDVADPKANELIRRKVKQGLEFAAANRMDRACEIWQEARQQGPTLAEVLYNLGVCAEISGHQSEALALYRQADRLLDRPDDRISAALLRVAQTPRK